MTKRALVTGGTGFIGTHLVTRLCSEGWEVHQVVRDAGRLDRQAMPNLTSRAFSPTVDSLAGILTTAKPDVVFHLATLFVAQHTPADVASLIDSNVRFGALLLEAMNLSGTRNLVNAGTAWQHYEDSSYSPTSLYAATKQAFESILKFYTDTDRVRSVTLKLFDTYGPHDRRRKVFHVLRQAAASGETIEMSPGEQRLNLVYIDDVISAFLEAARLMADSSKPNNVTYAVGAERVIRLKDLVAEYAAVTGRTFNIKWGAKPYREREVMTPWTKGERLPGWSPAVSLQEGIRRMETLDAKPPAGPR